MTSSLITGLPASIQLIASGGTPPYVYSIASGLPAGLSLNASTGLITGTPTTLQTATALVWGVQDSATPTPATSTDSFLVTVAAVPLAPPHYQFVPRVLGGMLMGGGPYPAPELYVAITSQPMTMAAVVIVPVPVVVAIAGRPMTMAAVITPRTTVDVAIAGRPMTMAAAVQNQSVDIAISSQPMTMEAVFTQATTVDVAITSQSMTMAAVAQNQSVDVAITSQPMTMAAAATGTLTVATGTKSPVGPDGMTQIISATDDDTFIEIALPFAFFAGNVSRTSTFVGSNTYLTFGAGSVARSSLSLASNPSQSSIHLGSADNSYQRVFRFNDPSNRFTRIRYEGAAAISGTPGSPNILWEVTLFNPSLSSGTQYVEVVFGVHNRTSGPFGVGGSGITPLSGGTIQENQSYVFSSGSTGVTWTIESGKFITL